MLTVRQKLGLARSARRMIELGRSTLGKGMRTICRRRSLQWDLDLDEGIDFSIYLLGAYDPESIQFYQHFVEPGFQVLDIGANIGSHALHLAWFASGSGRVFALEPTDFAFAKLSANRALNPHLAERLVLRQALLVEKAESALPEAIYSSWPLVENTKTLHELHGGHLQSLKQAAPITLDAFCLQEGIERIDFIKLDVDGNEINVLRGGREILNRLQPPIYMELAPFVEGDNSTDTFGDMLELIHHHRYSIYDTNLRPLPGTDEKLRKIIPNGAGINVLLRASK